MRIIISNTENASPEMMHLTTRDGCLYTNLLVLSNLEDAFAETILLVFDAIQCFSCVYKPSYAFEIKTLKDASFF